MRSESGNGGPTSLFESRLRDAMIGSDSLVICPRVCENLPAPLDDGLDKTQQVLVLLVDLKICGASPTMSLQPREECASGRRDCFTVCNAGCVDSGYGLCHISFRHLKSCLSAGQIGPARHRHVARSFCCCGGGHAFGLPLCMYSARLLEPLDCRVMNELRGLQVRLDKSSGLFSRIDAPLRWGDLLIGGHSASFGLRYTSRRVRGLGLGGGHGGFSFAQLLFRSF
mmetsp:Transcript_111683/g.315423  ORF Transcript_111683/g.315423 Transcript_111683/m.315423 type:complete len:226 (-) Transcript_111683:1516-2193(-)